MGNSKTDNKKLDKICIVKRNDKEIETVYLSDKKDESESGFLEMELDAEFKFQLVPNTKRERNILFVAGSSGSGKSFYCKQYLYEWIKLYPKRPIYMFSYLDEDSTLDEIKKIERININDADFLKEEIHASEFKDSCCIFDDIDTIPNKKIREKRI
eukprot:gene17149-35494_t